MYRVHVRLARTTMRPVASFDMCLNVVNSLVTLPRVFLPHIHVACAVVRADEVTSPEDVTSTEPVDGDDDDDMPGLEDGDEDEDGTSPDSKQSRSEKKARKVRY